MPDIFEIPPGTELLSFFIFFKNIKLHFLLVALQDYPAYFRFLESYMNTICHLHVNQYIALSSSTNSRSVLSHLIHCMLD